MKNNNFTVILLTCIYLFTLSSCLTTKVKKLNYFKSIENNSQEKITPYPKENTIKSSDLLQISIFCLDEETFKIFNGSNATSSTSSSTASGYLVDDSGNIKLPLLGSVRAAGLNKIQLADTISKQLVSKQFAINPIVSARIVNFKITLLGEVNKPGVILVPNEHITLAEAIGMAGDLTIYGNRDNILLIREKDGKRTSKRFSLNNKEIFTTEFYYLQNQDIIYIESTKTKATQVSRFTQNFSLILSSVSFLLLIYTTSKTF